MTWMDAMGLASGRSGMSDYWEDVLLYIETARAGLWEQRLPKYNETGTSGHAMFLIRMVELKDVWSNAYKDNIGLEGFPKNMARSIMGRTDNKIHKWIVRTYPHMALDLAQNIGESRYQWSVRLYDLNSSWEEKQVLFFDSDFHMESESYENDKNRSVTQARTEVKMSKDRIFTAVGVLLLVILIVANWKKIMKKMKRKKVGKK